MRLSSVRIIIMGVKVWVVYYIKEYNIYTSNNTNLHTWTKVSN